MYHSLLENIEAQLWQKVDEINQDHRMSSVQELKQALNEYRKANQLANPFRTETQMPTIAEQLAGARAKLAEARDGATKAVAELNDASSVVLGEVNKVLKEASDLRAEVAELTNGGPA